MKKYIVYLVCMVMGVSSCSTSKQATKDATVVPQKKTEIVVLPQNINAEAEVEVAMAGKNLTFPATLHMRRDKCIRLEIQVPLLGTEIGRLEFTPEYVLLIDRMNKQYAKETYDKIKSLSNADIDFKQLQALFWNDTNQKSVTKSENGLGSLTWSYSGFEKIDTKNFPCNQTITVVSKDNGNGRIAMNLSDLSTSSDWETESKVSSKYTKLDVNNLMEFLK